MSKIQLSKNFIKNIVKLALNEDLYPSGDITSSLVKDNKVIKVKLLSKFGFKFLLKLKKVLLIYV